MTVPVGCLARVRRFQRDNGYAVIALMGMRRRRRQGAKLRQGDREGAR